MIKVAAEEFVRHPAALLDEVRKGDEVWIEEGGRVIARLSTGEVDGARRPEPAAADVPSPVGGSEDHTFPAPEVDPVGTLFRLRERASLGDLSWRELRDEGRR